MARTDREETMTIRLSSDERKMVTALAEHDGVSSSDVVRMSIRRAFAERADRVLATDNKPRTATKPTKKARR
jgi:predicted DNA-binding protein